MDPTNELLQQLLQRPEAEWERAVEEACAQHPELAARVRRKFEILRRSGFAADSAAEAPQRLGEFTLGRLLGQGGMGIVHEARQDRLGRTVALKLVRPEQLYFPGARERFRREVEAVARLSHPGIVSVFTVGEEGGVPFFAMELLQGASLDDVLRELAGRKPDELRAADLAAIVARAAGVEQALTDDLFRGSWTDVCVAIGLAVAEALAHAHACGVVHRDVKPSNVMVTPRGRVVLLDFGLALPQNADRMTRAGSEIGSIPYMAPEQLRGEVGDARADVYGLGITLRELLTLRHPFLAPSRELTRRRVLLGSAPRLREHNRAVSWELETVCAKATDVEPGRRYPVMAELARDLANVQAHRRITARPAGRARLLLRWAQRQPAVATAMALGLLTTIGTPTAIAFAVAAQRDRALAAEAEEQSKGYEANLAAANVALQVNDAREARRRLDACPESRRGFEWRHLALALDGSLLALRGHGAEVTAVAMTADTLLLASGSADGEVRLWDLRSGAAVHCFTHHGARIDQLVFAPDGARLWIDDRSHHTSCVDVGKREVLAERRGTDAREQVWLGTGGRCVLASTGAWRFLALDPATLRPWREIALQQEAPAPEGLVATDGARLFAVLFGELHGWDLATGRLLCKVAMPGSASVGAIALTNGGERVAVADRLGRITVHRAADGAMLLVLSDRSALAEGDEIRSSGLAFDGKGHLLAATGTDGGLRVFDTANGALVSMQPGHEGPANAAAFGGSMLVATAGADRTIRLWSPYGGRDLLVLAGHAGAVRRVAVTSDGARLLSASEDGSLRVWSTADGAPQGFTGGHQHHANTLAITSDGQTAYSTFNDCVVATERSGTVAPPWPTGCAPILDLALAADDATLLAASADGRVLVLDARGRRVLRELRGHEGPVSACAFASGSAIAWTGGRDRRLLRWELGAGEAAPRCVHTAPLPVRALVLGRGEGTLVLAEGDLTADGAVRGDGAVERLSADGNVLWSRRCSSAALAITILPDQSRAVTGHADGTIAVWDLDLGAPVLVRRIAAKAVRTLCSDPGGRFVAAGDAFSSGKCYLLFGTRTIAPREVRSLAAAAAAMHLHAAIRSELRTPAETRELLAAEPDPELRACLQACERSYSPLTWNMLAYALELCEAPGFPPERYQQARLVAEEYGKIAPDEGLVPAIVGMASVRLHEAERALVASTAVPHTGRWTQLEPALRAMRALALQQLGRVAEARVELAALCDLAAAAAADPQTVSLWREVEAALR